MPGKPPNAEIASDVGLMGIDTPVKNEVQFIAIRITMPMHELRILR